MRTLRVVLAVVAIALAVVVAVGKASWKWHGKVGQAYTTHHVAGWSWGGHVRPPHGSNPPPQE